ncbi:hypothetical protein MBLNU230_g8443t1 [Neophaeotheca triangularis]
MTDHPIKRNPAPGNADKQPGKGSKRQKSNPQPIKKESDEQNNVPSSKAPEVGTDVSKKPKVGKTIPSKKRKGRPQGLIKGDPSTPFAPVVVDEADPPGTASAQPQQEQAQESSRVEPTKNDKQLSNPAHGRNAPDGGDPDQEKETAVEDTNDSSSVDTLSRDDPEYDLALDAATKISDMTVAGCEKVWAEWLAGNGKLKNRISNSDRSIVSELLIKHVIGDETTGGWKHFKDLTKKLNTTKRKAHKEGVTTSKDLISAQYTFQRKANRLHTCLKEHPLVYKALQEPLYTPINQAKTLQALVLDCKDAITDKVETEYQTCRKDLDPSYATAIASDPAARKPLFTTEQSRHDKKTFLDLGDTELGQRGWLFANVAALDVDMEAVARDQLGTVRALKIALCRLEIHKRVYEARRRDAGAGVRARELRVGHEVANWRNADVLRRTLREGVEGMEDLWEEGEGDGEERGEVEGEKGGEVEGEVKGEGEGEGEGEEGEL